MVKNSLLVRIVRVVFILMILTPAVLIAFSFANPMESEDVFSTEESVMASSGYTYVLALLKQEPHLLEREIAGISWVYLKTYADESGIVGGHYRVYTMRVHIKIKCVDGRQDLYYLAVSKSKKQSEIGTMQSITESDADAYKTAMKKWMMSDLSEREQRYGAFAVSYILEKATEE